MKAFQCKFCGELVIPGVSEGCLADHLMWTHRDKFEEYQDQEHLICSIDCRDHFLEIDEVTAFNIWQPVKIYRVHQVYARTAGEAMERYRKGEGKYSHSPYLEDPAGSFTMLPGAFPMVDEQATEICEEDQAMAGA